MSQKVHIATARILVVDDQTEVTEIIQTFLGSAGYEVSVVNEATEAIRRAHDFKPNVILLDIMMPGRDGYDICRELKEDPRFSNIPIIFLTGRDRNDDQGRSFQSGGDMFIKKPFSCERLLDIVNIVLMSSRGI